MSSAKEHVVCVKNRGFAASLEIGKVYRALGGRPRDRVAERDGLLRVVDESGEDYLYPRSFFVTVALPALAVTAIARARRSRLRRADPGRVRSTSAGGTREEKSRKSAAARR
jgi:hypothetical protein